MGVVVWVRGSTIQEELCKLAVGYKVGDTKNTWWVMWGRGISSCVNVDNVDLKKTQIKTFACQRSS